MHLLVQTKSTFNLWGMSASGVHGLVNLLLLCNLEANDSVWPTRTILQRCYEFPSRIYERVKGSFLKGFAASYAHI